MVAVFLFLLASVSVFAFQGCEKFLIQEKDEIIYENPQKYCMEVLVESFYSEQSFPFKIRFTESEAFTWVMGKIEFLGAPVTIETTFNNLLIYDEKDLASLVPLLNRVHTETSPFLQIHFDAVAFSGIVFKDNLCNHLRDIATLQTEIAMIDCYFLCDPETFGDIIEPSSNLKRLTLGKEMASEMTEFVDWICLSLESGNAWNVEMLVLSYEEYSQEFMESVGSLLSIEGNNIKEFGIAFPSREESTPIVDALLSQSCQVEHLIILQAGADFSEMEDTVLHGNSKITKVTAQMEELLEIKKVMRLSTLPANSITVMHIRVNSLKIVDAMEEMLNSPNCRLHSLHLSFPDIEGMKWKKVFISRVLETLLIATTKIKSLTLLNYPMSLIETLEHWLRDDDCEIYHLDFYPKREDITTWLKPVMDLKKQLYDPSDSFKKEDYAISYVNNFWDEWYDEDLDDSTEVDTPPPQNEEPEPFYQLEGTFLYFRPKTADQAKFFMNIMGVIQDPFTVTAVVFENIQSEVLSNCVRVILEYVSSTPNAITHLAFRGGSLFPTPLMLILSNLLMHSNNRIMSMELPQLEGSGMRVLLDTLRHPDCYVAHLQYAPTGQYSFHIQEQVTQQLADNIVKLNKLNYKIKDLYESAVQKKLEHNFSQYLHEQKSQNEERKSRKRKVSETDLDDDHNMDGNDSDDGSSFDSWLERGKFKLGDKFQRLNLDDIEE